MEYRRLGRTGLKVSELCLGTMQWGWTADENTAFEVMDAFVRRAATSSTRPTCTRGGSQGNPGGVSEEIIGRWMKARGNRQDIVLATKARGRMWEGPNGEGLEPRSPDARGGRLAAPAADRLHRPVPDALRTIRRRRSTRRCGRWTTWSAQARCATSARRTSRPSGCAARCGRARSTGSRATTRCSRTTTWRTGPSSSASSSRCARTRASA